MHLKEQLQFILEQVRSFGFYTEELVFAPPAQPNEVQYLEQALGISLPSKLRDTLLTVSGHVEFQWIIPYDLGFPEPFGLFNGGHLDWSAEAIQSSNEAKNTFVNNVFPNRSDSYASVWRNKLAFAQVGLGDYWAIDLDPMKYEQVVYLRRINNNGKVHGYVLAEDFQDLIRRWVPLACPGRAERYWIPFTNDLTTPIDPNCENAKAWRALLELSPNITCT